MSTKRGPSVARTAASASRSKKRPRTVVPDAIDFRDRVYAPPIGKAPPGSICCLPADLDASLVLNQGDTSACTGYALAVVIERLLTRAARFGDETAARRRALRQVSPGMLYSMARRYDEFAGFTKDDGSSVRGALKGWFKHGACRRELWPLDVATDVMPAADPDPSKDWWPDATRRPLGAYYRIPTEELAAMRVALDECGVLYASAIAHAGWDEGDGFEGDGVFTIPSRAAAESDGGHAFAIVGYDAEGFVLQNSWGTGWGTRGYARLRYDDWLANAMDVWVAQLGVVTTLHEQIASSSTLRIKGSGRDRLAVELAGERTLRNRELSPFIVNVGNDGRLSDAGEFRTKPDDLEALVGMHFDAAKERFFGAKKSPTMDIAIYAHGGLVSERDAADVASHWIPRLYGSRIFPVFLMWETGLFETLNNLLKEAVRGEPRPARGRLGDMLRRLWFSRVERAVAPLGKPIWDEIKENAERMAVNRDGTPNLASGVMQLYAAAVAAGHFGDNAKANVRLHLIGHSAGSIVIAHVLDQLLRLHPGLTVESVTFMAPAIRVELFEKKLLPWMRLPTPRIRRYVQFHLAEAFEQRDPTCGPYGRSLLYLVSGAFEGERDAAILGLERDWNGLARTLAKCTTKIQTYAAPCLQSGSTTHGGFDDLDDPTADTIVQHILGG